MIILALRSLSALSSISELQLIKDYAQNVYAAGVLNIIVTFISFAALVVFFSVARSNKRSFNIHTRARKSEILYILSITVLSLSLVYLVSEVYFLIVSMQYYEFSVISFLFDVTFIVFSIINIVKSHLFKMAMKQKLKIANKQRF